MKKSIYTLSFLTLLILGCQSEEISKPIGTKLDYYIESTVFDELDYPQQQKVVYQYNEEGSLNRYTVLTYSTVAKSFHEHHYFDFSYVNGHVDLIKGYLTAATIPFVVYTYQYSQDGRVLKIIEDEAGFEKISEANFTYNDTDESIKVIYSGLNKIPVEYELFFENKNIVRDKSTRESLPCSDGEYLYDQHKNPFNDLGYVDYYSLSNLSVNNKLEENINYAGCSVPSMVPESYEYEYNKLGYPTIVNTVYKSEKHIRSKRKYFYK